jgi:hypothetical protein
MHTSTELESADFEIAINGEPAGLNELLPGFEEQSRLGVVVRDGFGAVGASTLITASITGFYDIMRANSPDGFFRYADFFLFHVGAMRGNHHMLDVSPDHKEVLVPDDAEQILRAVNDRGVTHLLVPDGLPGRPLLEPQTRNSAESRIKAALAYSSGGQTAGADVFIKGTSHVDGYVRETLDGKAWVERLEAEGGDATVLAWARSRLGEVDDEEIARIADGRRELIVDGRTVESFRRVTLDQALALLVPAQVPSVGPEDR